MRPAARDRALSLQLSDCRSALAWTLAALSGALSDDARSALRSECLRLEDAAAQLEQRLRINHPAHPWTGRVKL